MELPAGWVMLPAINPVTNIPEANMIAAHPESHSFAALLIVRNSQGPDLEEALSRMVDQRRKSDPTVVEIKRVNAQFGRLDGRKALLDWEYKGTKAKGSVSVAHSGPYYFVLIEWCLAETYAKSRPQFAALENGASAGEPAPNQFTQSHGQTY